MRVVSTNTRPPKQSITDATVLERPPSQTRLMQVASFTGSGTTVDVNSRYTSCSAVSRSSGLWSPPKVRQKAPSPTFTSTRLPARMSFRSCGDVRYNSEHRVAHHAKRGIHDSAEVWATHGGLAVTRRPLEYAQSQWQMRGWIDVDEHDGQRAL